MVRLCRVHLRVSVSLCACMASGCLCACMLHICGCGCVRVRVRVRVRSVSVSLPARVCVRPVAVCVLMLHASVYACVLLCFLFLSLRAAVPQKKGAEGTEGVEEAHEGARGTRRRCAARGVGNRGCAWDARHWHRRGG